MSFLKAKLAHEFTTPRYFDESQYRIDFEWRPVAERATDREVASGRVPSFSRSLPSKSDSFFARACSSRVSRRFVVTRPTSIATNPMGLLGGRENLSRISSEAMRRP